MSKWTKSCFLIFVLIFRMFTHLFYYFQCNHYGHGTWLCIWLSILVNCVQQTQQKRLCFFLLYFKQSVLLSVSIYSWWEWLWLYKNQNNWEDILSAVVDWKRRLKNNVLHGDLDWADRVAETFMSMANYIFLSDVFLCFYLVSRAELVLLTRPV